MAGAQRDDGWRAPNDIRDIDFGDDDPDGGTLVPANPRPLPSSPAMEIALAVPVG